MSLANCLMGLLALIAAFPAAKAAPISYQTVPKGINNLGQIVGFSSDIAGTHGFLYSNGVFTAIDIPGTENTIAYGINDAGDILLFDNSHSRSYVYDATGNFTEVTLPGSTFVWANGINNAGEIVGFTGDGAEAWGFVKRASGVERLQVPGSIETNPYAISNTGDIVGRFVTSQDHGFLYSRGVITPLDFPGSHWTQLRGINTAGHIVGNAAIGEGFFPFPFLYSDGQLTILEMPATEYPVGIPEPGSLITIASGLVLLVFGRRVRG